MQLSTIYCRAYIQSNSYFNPDFYICPSYEQISLLSTSLDCIVKIIKPLHDMPKAKFAYNLFFSRLSLKQLSETIISSDCVSKFAIYYPNYKKIPKITEYVYNFFLFRPPPQLSLSPDKLPDYIGRLAIYHSHYKDKFVDNPTQALVCAANYLCFLSKFNNVSAALLFACNGRAAQPALVVKKKKLPKSFIYFFSHPL